MHIPLATFRFSIRLDSTLIDFADMKWQRGDISIIFNGEAEGLYYKYYVHCMHVFR